MTVECKKCWGSAANMFANWVKVDVNSKVVGKQKVIIYKHKQYIYILNILQYIKVTDQCIANIYIYFPEKWTIILKKDLVIEISRMDVIAEPLTNIH